MNWKESHGPRQSMRHGTPENSDCGYNMKTKAAVLYEMGMSAPYAETGPLQIEELDLSGPGPDDVLVEVAYAGLCHSDLSVIDGSRPRVMPMVLGHEASGIVREPGVNVKDLKDGDHVVFSFIPSCGHCLSCASGRPVLCGDGARANVNGTLLSGRCHFSDAKGNKLFHHLGVSAFSEYTVAARASLVKIDPEFPLDIATLFGCAVVTGVGAIANTAKVSPGSSVAVFGMGGVGLSATLGAKAAGAATIIAVDLVDEKLSLASSVGATHVVNPSRCNAVDVIRDISGGGVDYAIEVVGNEKVLAQAYESTGRGGTTVSVGLPHPEKRLSIPAVSLVTDEKTIKGSYMGSAVPSRDLLRYMAMSDAGLLPVDKLVSSEIALEDINVAFDRLAQGDAVRQLVNFTSN